MPGHIHHSQLHAMSPVISPNPATPLFEEPSDPLQDGSSSHSAGWLNLLHLQQLSSPLFPEDSGAPTVLMNMCTHMGVCVCVWRRKITSSIDRAVLFFILFSYCSTCPWCLTHLSGLWSFHAFKVSHLSCYQYPATDEKNIITDLV